MIVQRFIWRYTLSVLTAGFVLVASAPDCSGNERSGNEPGATANVLQADGKLQWFRGNMHTHSLWSDGDDYLEMIALWYRDHDYQFLVFTDHNVLADSERWVDVEESKGGLEAFEKLKAKFPQFVRERMVVKEIADDGANDEVTNNEETASAEESATIERVLEVRLRTFEEVSQQMNEPGKFLLVQGEEISDQFETFPIHINVGNIVELIEPKGGRSVAETIQNNIRAAMVQREKTGQPMIAHVNHPNFGFSITAEDLMQIRGDHFFEVYNGHPGVANAGDEHHAGTERMWDIVLTRRLAELHLPVMFGLAVDDGHNYHNVPDRRSNPGRGWVMVLAKDLSAESLIDSLEAGRFYASSGVALSKVESSSEGFTVEIEPIEGETYTIDFIGTRKGYDAESYPVVDSEGKEVRATRSYSHDVGETLKTVEGNRGTYRFTGDEIYVRARVTSSADHPNPSEIGDKKQAWCQPAVGLGVE